MRKDRMKTKEYSAGSTVLTVAFVLICLVWIMPIYEVVVNSLKSNNVINLPSSPCISFVSIVTVTFAILLMGMVWLIVRILAPSDAMLFKTEDRSPLVWSRFMEMVTVFPLVFS